MMTSASRLASGFAEMQHGLSCSRSESYEKDVEVAALEATTLLDGLKDSLYVRCPAMSGQLPPAVPCPDRASPEDTKATQAAQAAFLQLPARSRVTRPAQPSAGWHQSRTGCGLWQQRRCDARFAEKKFSLRPPPPKRQQTCQMSFVHVRFWC